MATGFPVKANYATGDVLTAANMNDLSGTVNTLQYPIYNAAGKNKIINGDFGIWQRGTSFNAATTFYTADRWMGYSYSGASQTISQQSFTAGTAPVSGYEGQYFLRATATNTGINFEQRIEDVRTLAGQTVTLSFWAKSASAQTITLYINQNFGSGGSSQVTAITGTQALTTSWTRYSLTGTVTSVAGKTIGTSSYLQVNFIGSTINNAVDIWGVQLEAGSTASGFQTATGTIQGELAACQRYYWRTSITGYAPATNWGMATSTTAVNAGVSFPSTLRTAPTSLDYALLRATDTIGVASNISTLTLGGSTTNLGFVDASGLSGFTQYRPAIIQAQASGSAYLGFSAEL